MAVHTMAMGLMPVSMPPSGSVINLESLRWMGLSTVVLLVTLWAISSGALMRDLLPEHVYNSIRDRYIAGVADAEQTFLEHAAEEDAVTGALGQELSRGAYWEFLFPGGTLYVKVGYTKVRGRGPKAPERIYGTDGLFQISVTDSAGRVVRRKGLPFQAKKRWTGRDAEVLRQARDMEANVGPGIIVDYSERGYVACTSGAAIAADGNKRTAQANRAIRPLGQILANDFLPCSSGTIDLFFDVGEERYVGGIGDLPPRSVITTDVRFSVLPDEER